MIRVLTIAIACMASVATAQTTPELCARLELVDSNLETFDPAIFAPGPNADVYHLLFTNASDDNVTSMNLTLPGQFLDFSLDTPKYRLDASLPTLGPNIVADSFFVVDEVPPVGIELPFEGLQGSFLREVLPGMTVPIAVLSVVSGLSIDTTGWTGTAMSASGDNAITFSTVCVPESSAVLLSLASLVVIAARTRVV